MNQPCEVCNTVYEDGDCDCDQFGDYQELLEKYQKANQTINKLREEIDELKSLGSFFYQAKESHPMIKSKWKRFSDICYPEWPNTEL